MSTRVESWPEYASGVVEARVAERPAETGPRLEPYVDWPYRYLNDQLEGLVRQLFLDGSQRPKRVVFSGLGGAGSAWLCARTAERIAGEVLDDVCVVDATTRESCLSRQLAIPENSDGQSRTLIRKGNLWFCSSATLFHGSESLSATENLRNRVSRLRKEFGYLVIHAPAFGQEDIALVIGQMADGVVLTLEAGATRRATAVRACEMLEAAGIKLLGVVLGERNFPIPESIYRRF